MLTLRALHSSSLLVTALVTATALFTQPAACCVVDLAYQVAAYTVTICVLDLREMTPDAEVREKNLCARRVIGLPSCVFVVCLLALLR